MNLILFDDPSCREALFPLTLNRPVAEIRVGILTLTQKWQQHLQTDTSFFTAQYLKDKYPLHTSEDNLWVNGAICPDNNLLDALRKLPMNSRLTKRGTILAVHNNKKNYTATQGLAHIEYPSEITLIDQPWKIFQQNASQLRSDFDLITTGRVSYPIDDIHTRTYGKVGENIFIEQGVRIKAATLNAEEGPIYLGKNTLVQEGAMIQGPFALCEGATVNMGAKIKATTIGPYAKVGGETNCTVFFGYSNKAHDGFLGHTVVGMWCNLGAGTNTSNLKNTYGNVKIWSYAQQALIDTGLQFCGLIMGDYSRCGINTMFNTGTTVAIGCSIFGSGFPPSLIPSFTWGGTTENHTYRLDALVDTVKKTMVRRKKTLTLEEQRILEFLFANPPEESHRHMLM